MDGIATTALRLLLEQGLGWVVSVILSTVIYFLWREIKARDSVIEKCQAARIEEALKIVLAREEHAKALNANSLALEGNNKAMEARTRATESVERTLADLVNRSEAQNERLMDRATELRKLVDEGVAIVRDLQRAGGRRQ